MESNAGLAPSRRRTRRFGAALVTMLACVVASDAGAEFHVWYDARGHKQVSTVPTQGFDRNGAIRSAYNPNSIVYQHTRMRRALAAQSYEITLRREQEAANALEIKHGARETREVRHAPREGIMNLDELIALDKRGGRYQDPAAGQSGASASLK